VGRCRDCGRRVQGRHPEQSSDALGAAASQVGPVAKGWAAWLHYGLGLSFAKCARLLARLGIDVTAGALCSAAQRAGTDLVPVHAQIVRRLNEAEMVVADETGWRVEGDGAWLWVATTTDATAYNVAKGRGFDAATEVIDEDYDGVLVRDGWAPYRRYTNAAHQSCAAHLLRRARELVADLPAWARGTPRQVGDILGQALAARDLDEAGRAATIEDLAERVELLGQQPQPHDECRKLVAHLLNERAALFTFLARPHVDATNWRAEQAIRPAVVNRKVWGGNRTWRGAATQSRIMSVLRTATQRGVDEIDFLARLARAPTPAAIPPLFS
jgi:transposase